ncbi:hypothetical protein B0H16DRAFT_1502578 [Mycena metata]|uniref:Uncharacterized protein n=1 Tax=Mycena metata TaxID=1033252 RepID=A0AAD7K752_9AGAR|nr:hypothetical protein B0H16DRAFT_1502578 [Mycena metata]
MIACRCPTVLLACRALSGVAASLQNTNVMFLNAGLCFRAFALRFYWYSDRAQTASRSRPPSLPCPSLSVSHN